MELGIVSQVHVNFTEEYFVLLACVSFIWEL